MQDLLHRLESVKEHPFCIGIDGMGTSGKTSLAGYIARRFPAALVHVDDYFLPFKQRTPLRLKQPMGNIEWERLRTEILERIGESVVNSAPFDCAAGDYAADQSYDLSGLVIIEGVSSLRRELRNYYDLSVYIGISPEERLARIKRRDPEWKQEKWLLEWIPWEDSYFSTHKPEVCADVVLDGGAFPVDIY